MNINVNDIAYPFKERLTIEDWQTLAAYNFNDEKSYPYIIHHVTGAPITELVAADTAALQLPVALVLELMDRRTEIKGKHVDKINFGEFVDIDVYINMGLEKHVRDICNILLVNTDWADEALYAVSEYDKYRTYIYRQYRTLFGLDDRNFEGEVEVDEVDRAAVAKNWYRIIVSLANDDLTKIDEITNQPLKKVLNFMALQKENRLEEERKQLQQRRQYDLQTNRR